MILRRMGFSFWSITADVTHWMYRCAIAGMSRNLESELGEEGGGV